MVDDPSAHPDRFPTEPAQARERERLFGIIRELVKWENTNDEKVLGQAREGDPGELAPHLRRERGPSTGGGVVRPGPAPRLP